MAKGKKYKKWYESHREEIESRQQESTKNMYALKMDKDKFYPNAKEEPTKIVHPVHGYFIYECEACGAVYQMYLDRGLEDREQDKQKPDQHKPVPFMIGCRNCEKGYCKHILWGIGDSNKYNELPEGESYFKNDPNEPCGVAVYNKSYRSKDHWLVAAVDNKFGFNGRFA